MTLTASMSDDFSEQCPTCKAKLDSGAGQDFLFCPRCGARLPDSSEQKIFDAARELESDRRKEFLDSVCGNDSALRTRIEALLAAHSVSDSLLDLPATAPPPAGGDSPQSAEYSLPADTQIGKYKLLQKIGEGGMGSVYMAEQQEPVRRVVALKVVKAGFDSKQVVARFEAERQTLALMDHPNIAKVLDAGETERGEPYFVMELVKGVPLTEYCDTNRITTRERIKLVADVCNAVQHAHQKGIIHRDLKPSNILVAQYDDRPVPKVIDFGVAKATHQKLTEKTLYTQLGQIVGTLKYMSPEQAVLNQLDVDTRTDVYSLGVILYELLVGETPLASKELRSQGLEQILRTIREQEPARPSVRLSSQGPAATQTAAYRQTDQGTLSRVLRGDLDWVVMKALEKDRVRRYDSASRLAEDLKHYLAGDTVEARPPTAGYRLKKTWQRNRVLFSSAAAVILALSIGLLGMWWQNSALQESKATLNSQTDELQAALDENKEKQKSLESALQSWREELLDRGIEAAFRGDDQAVQDVVAGDNSDKARLPKHWRLMLEGLSVQFGGDALAAQKHFEKALEYEENSVAIKSALASSMINRRIDQNRWQELMFELDSSMPINSSPYQKYDELLYGWSLVYIDPHRSAELLRQVVKRPWPIGNSMLAQAIAHDALDKTDPDKARRLATEALELSMKAEKRAGDNPFVVAIGVFVRCVAIQILGPDSVNQAEVDDFAASIYGKPNLWQGANILSHYYALVNHEKAVEQFKACLDEDWAGACAVGYLFERDIDFPLPRIPTDVDTKQPYALIAAACVDAKDNPQEAAKFVSWIKQHFASIYVNTYALEIFLHAGDVAQAKAEAKQLLEEIEPGKTLLADGPWARPRDRLRLIAGEMQPGELESIMAESAIFRCYGNHILGLTAHAMNQPDIAERHFEAVLESGQFYIPQFYMASALLKHMDSGDAE